MADKDYQLFDDPTPTPESNNENLEQVLAGEETTPEANGETPTTGQVEEPTMPEATNAEQQESNEPTTYTIKHNGEEVNLTLEELTALANKGYDYTKKTQELAAERKKLGAIGGLLENNPDLEQVILDSWNGEDDEVSQPTEETPPEEANTEEDSKEAPATDLPPEIQQEVDTVASKEVDLQLKELENLAANYNIDYDEEDIIKYAIENNIPNLEAAFKSFYIDEIYQSGMSKGADEYAKTLAEISGEARTAGTNAPNAGKEKKYQLFTDDTN